MTTENFSPRSNRTVKLAFAAALIFLAAPLARAQTATSPQSPDLPQWQIDAGTHAEFDVASVRPAPPDAPHRGYEIIINPLLNPYAEDAPPKGLVSANAAVVNYIIFAYKIYDVNQMHQLSQHLPAWARSDDYVIEARAVGSPTRDQTRLMMQSLLADRFHLKAHFETRVLPVYELVPAKGGLKITEIPAPPERKPGDPPLQMRPGDPLPPGSMRTMMNSNGLRIVDARAIQMQLLARIIGGDAGDRPIVDHSGFAGYFDVTGLTWAPLGDAGATTAPDAPSLTVALQEKLGLKLVPAKDPIEVLVIDSIDRPTEN